MVKREEGRGSWYELCFRSQKIEIVVTGGLFNEEHDNKSKLCAFLGVSASRHMAHDSNFILFSPTIAVETLSCARMLKNYGRKASMNKWCFKSLFFGSMNFATPNQFQLSEQEQEDYASVCSELLRLVVNGELSESDMESLENKLVLFEYWKSLGFKKLPLKQNVLERLRTMEVWDILLKYLKYN